MTHLTEKEAHRKGECNFVIVFVQFTVCAPCPPRIAAREALPDGRRGIHGLESGNVPFIRAARDWGIARTMDELRSA